MARGFCFSGIAGIAGTVALAWGVAGSGGCSAGHAGARPEGGVPRPAELIVQRGRMASRFLMTGQLEAVTAVNLVVPEIPSWQTTVRWAEAEGAVVTPGQKLIEFDTAATASEYSEKVLLRDQAESDLLQAEADTTTQRTEKTFQVSQKRIAVEKAKLAAAIPAEFLRGKEWQDNQIALERASTELAKAEEDLKAQVMSAAETLQQKRIALEKVTRELRVARSGLDGMVLLAPRDGILVMAEHPWYGRKIEVGDPVFIGMTVARLPDLSKMRVVAKLSDVDDGRVAAGMAARCTLDAYPDRPYEGKVADVMPVAQSDDAQSLRRAYTVRVDLDASDAERMRPGMSVKVEVEERGSQEGLLAPRAGLDLTGASARARLASGHDVPVGLGACDEQTCLVETGLHEGDRLRPAP